MTQRFRSAATAGLPTAAGVASAAAAALLAGCAAVGPDYSGPPPVAPASIENAVFVRGTVAPARPAPPPARWWESVADPLLTRLIDDAFAASPTLATAVARVRSALSQQAVNRAALLPTGGGSARDTRGRIPTGALGTALGGNGSAAGTGTSLPDPIDLNTESVTFNASWEIDVFGGRRRNIESATANAQSQQAALEDAQVTLANDMAQAYARLREAQNRVVLALRTIRLRDESLSLARQRRAAGTLAQGDVERAGVELASAGAEVPGLQTQVEQQLDQIAILAGQEPGHYDALLAAPDGDRLVDQPLPPQEVPVGQPADWLRRRPDIRRAERVVAARNAAIGVNVAALFPTVSLLGVLGTAGPHPGDLFRGAPIWLLAPSLTWNFLNIPTHRARVKGAEADFDASVADYRRTVLAALQDANDSLSRFGRSRETLALRDKAREAADRSARIARERFAGGTVALGDVLDAERQRTQAEDQWAQAGSSLMVAYAALQRSLGVGWGAAPPQGATR